MGRKKSEKVFFHINSIAEFAAHLSESGEQIAFRYFDKERNILSVTYAELSEKIRNLAAGLSAKGLAGKRIAIIGETSVEWVTTYIATVASGGVAIPLDRELDPDELKGFLSFAEADAISFGASFNEKFANLPATHDTVKTLIPFHPESEAASDSVIPFSELLKAGEANTDYTYPVADLERMAEMLFTSGTTGSSKCVMLSEKNICAAVNSACATVDFSAEDSIVSILPIHHTYELCIMLAALNFGLNVAINDSLKRVLRNIELFKPTGLILVPLFVSTMNKKVWDEARKSGKEPMLKYLSEISKTLRKLSFDVRKTLFKQVGTAFGGNLEKIVCGGAPLNPEVADSFSEFGIDIYEGYGITECSPLIAVNPYEAPKRGSVGPSVPACQVRIDVDHVNERGIPEGEIQVKGDNVMMGYYKNPEETAKVFTEDGWFCTGDIGYMDGDGYIFITGRKKYVIISDNGKNVFPEEIEEYLSKIDLISECVVVGRKDPDSDAVILTALVYPAADKFENPEDTEGMEKAIWEQISKLNRKLVSYKQIRKIELRREPFPKTTSKKIKRHLVY